VIQNSALEPLQRQVRLEAELLDERLPRFLVGAQRVRLAAGPVQREHQLPAQTLAERVLGDERLELADCLIVAAEREVAVNAVHLRRQAQLLEAADLVARR
jgi:hypothetical protein